jgi:hypothetical protein
MRRITVVTALVSLLLVGLAPVHGATPEEVDRSPNVKQLGKVDMKLPNGSPWETGFMAFQGDILVSGSGFDQLTEDVGNQAPDVSYAKGFGVFRILPKAPYLKQLSFYRCSSGQQGDISIWKQYVFLSVTDSNNYTSSTCNNTDDSAGKFGIRIVDISDPRHPRQVKFVETTCGSQMHSIVPGSGGVVYIYDAHGGACATGSPTPSFRMDVVRFDPEHPRQAGIATAPNLGTQDGCVDIAVFMPRHLAACMSYARAALYDISDPLNPELLYEIVPPGASNMNEAGFTWDGEVLVLSDQGEGLGFTAACSGEASTPDLFFYKLETESEPIFLGKYEFERVVVPNTDRRFVGCFPWDFTIVPTKDRSRYVAAVGQMAGGMSLVDFTDPAAAKEIAYFTAKEGAVSASDIAHTYWYRGRFYAGEWQTRKGIRVIKVDGFTRETVRDMWRHNPQTQVR